MALEEDTTALVIHVSKEFFQYFDPNFGMYQFVLRSDKTNRDNEFFTSLRYLAAQMMLLMVNSESTDRQLWLESHFLAMTSDIYREIDAVKTIPIHTKPADMTVATFDKMIAYIDENYKQKIELEDIAKIGGYNIAYTSQFFKRQMGISFVEYVLRLHDEFKRGEQIREIRDCASKVMIKPEDDNTYGFYFPVISEKYHKELLYYYGLDDTLNFEVEKEIFVECEKYLHDKINVKELIKHPQKIYIFYNILNRMANVIDTKYFELCKKRVMSDLNKISSSSLRSLDDNTNKVIIGSKDELATFLALSCLLIRFK